MPSGHGHLGLTPGGSPPGKTIERPRSQGRAPTIDMAPRFSAHTIFNLSRKPCAPAGIWQVVDEKVCPGRDILWGIREIRRRTIGREHGAGRRQEWCLGVDEDTG